MKREVKIAISLYVIADYIFAALAWIVFLYYRKNLFEPQTVNAFTQSLTQKDIFNFLFFVPLFWCILHTFSGAYFNPYRKSRIIEVYRTLIISILGTILFYFLIFIDDDHNDFHYFYKSFFIYFILQFGATSLGRFFVLNHIKSQINS